MKKIILFIFIIFIFQALSVGAAGVSYITGNLLPAETEITAPEPDEEFYDYDLVFANVKINLYSLLNIAESLPENTVKIEYKNNDGKNITLRLYKNDILQRKISCNELTEGKYVIISAAEKTLTLTGTVNDSSVIISAAAKQASENPAEYINAIFSISENRMYISAQAMPMRGKAITAVLANKNNSSEIVHIEQVFSDYNGDFNIDFKFDGDINEYSLKVIIDGQTYNIEIISDDTQYIADTAVDAVFDGEGLNVFADRNNAFIGESKTSRIVSAFYNSDGVLILCAMADNFEPSMKINEIPYGTVKIKVFVMDVLNGLLPQTKSVELLLTETY